MEIQVNYLDGKKTKASFNGFEVISDQSKSAGGSGEFPEPYDYFPVSLALCAAHYVRSFCETREIDHQPLRVRLEVIKSSDNPIQRQVIIEIQLPSDFPQKYHKAVAAAAQGCTVKKVIEAGLQIDIRVK